MGEKKTRSVIGMGRFVKMSQESFWINMQCVKYYSRSRDNKGPINFTLFITPCKMKLEYIITLLSDVLRPRVEPRTSVVSLSLSVNPGILPPNPCCWNTSGNILTIVATYLVLKMLTISIWSQDSKCAVYYAQWYVKIVNTTMVYWLK